MQMTQTATRRGGVTLATLLLLPLLFLALVLAIFVSEAVLARTEQHNSADASVLATASALVDDPALSANPKILKALLASAKEQGKHLANQNLVLGKGVELRDPKDDKDDGDFVFGVRSPDDEKIVPLNLSREGILNLSTINAVQVIARRTQKRDNPLRLLRGPFLHRVPTDLTLHSTAFIDRDVIGIRPLPGIAAPLAPIALFSDPTGEQKQSWEYQTSQGNDLYAMDRSHDRPHPVSGKPDGLREMTVRVTGKEANALLLLLGVEKSDDLARQLLTGVSEKHLADLDGELVLGKTGSVVVPGTHASNGQLGLLAVALNTVLLRGDALVWPLYRGIEPKSGMPLVTGFVAARVVAVGVENKQFVFVVQPAQRVVASLVSAASRDRTFAKNRYLARVRLADRPTPQGVQ